MPSETRRASKPGTGIYPRSMQASNRSGDAASTQVGNGQQQFSRQPYGSQYSNLSGPNGQHGDAGYLGPALGSLARQAPTTAGPTQTGFNGELLFLVAPQEILTCVRLAKKWPQASNSTVNGPRTDFAGPIHLSPSGRVCKLSGPSTAILPAICTLLSSFQMQR